MLAFRRVDIRVDRRRPRLPMEQSPAEPLRRSRKSPTDGARPRAPCRYKKNHIRRRPPPTCWIAAVSAAKKNLTRSRGATEKWKAVTDKKNNLPLEPRSGSILIAVGFNPRKEVNVVTLCSKCATLRRSRKRFRVADEVRQRNFKPQRTQRSQRNF